MKQQLEILKKETLEAIQPIESLEILKDLEVSVLGRKGQLTHILKGLKDLSIEGKKEIGPLSNALKNELNEAIIKKRKLLEKIQLDEQLASEWCDVTHTPKKFTLGNIHPITQVQQDLEDIFMKLGFSIYDGQEMDTEYFNFDALNIPNTHPARDMQDTFFVDLPKNETGEYVMRTHTSNLQNRIYKECKPPFRMFVPGKVYRNESIDAFHEMIFHQCEGIVVGENVHLGHLKYTVEKALSIILEGDIKTRFRPGYFPFVEPGVELDMWNPYANKWMEFMGCGMIHPEVLRQGGIDPEKYNGFAFGFGLTRLAMMRYGITDIRQLLAGDQRFVEQF